MDRAKLDPSGFFRRIPLLPHQMTDRVTRVGDMIVLCHLGVPRLDRDAWTLAIGGLVDRPRSLTFAELLRFPKHEVQTIHQCAGSPLAPREPTRRICNVTWGGARLGEILETCGIRPEARFVWSSGADHGEFGGVSADRYVKDLPLSRLADDVLVAYEVNGATLPAENGFPARLVVPGFYGTNSVKWLTGIRLEAGRAPGPFTTRWYNDPVLATDGTDTGRTEPVWSIAPESLIVSPRPGAQLSRGVECVVWGWAWADRGIARAAAGTAPISRAGRAEAGRNSSCAGRLRRPELSASPRGRPERMGGSSRWQAGGMRFTPWM